MSQERLRRFLDSAPAGTLVPIESLRELVADSSDSPLTAPTTVVEPETWRTLLWRAPPEARLGRAELLEAVGRPASWLYRHTGAKAKHRIPHRKLDGELTFVVGEVRRWLRDHEAIVEAGPTA